MATRREVEIKKMNLLEESIKKVDDLFKMIADIKVSITKLDLKLGEIDEKVNSGTKAKAKKNRA